MSSTEDDLTRYFAELFGPPDKDEIWTGDDAAVIATGARTVVTVDGVSEGVDFDRAWATGEDIGYKLAAINVSDIAAMGARPTRAVATVAVGEEDGPEMLRDIALGLAEAARRWGFSVVGGDIGSAAELVATLTLLGEPVGRPVLRSGASPGDVLMVTGTLGAAAAGLVALSTGRVMRDEVRFDGADDGLAGLAARQLRPTVRAEEGAAVAGIATAMVDVSDGLALDLARLCRASGTGCEVPRDAIPVDPALEVLAGKVGAPIDPWELALTGGEDFELLFTVPGPQVEEARTVLARSGTPVTVLGAMGEGPVTVDGVPIERWAENSWDHLRNQ